jgi:hypothetical protein
MNLAEAITEAYLAKIGIIANQLLLFYWLQHMAIHTKQ